MDFNELIEAFSARHGLPSLSSQDGMVALDIDGMTVEIVSSGDIVTITSEVGEPPVEGRAGFADLLLESNMHSDILFAKASGAGVYMAMRRLSLQLLDVEAFDAALEALVNMVETWRRILVDYRPAAAAAAEKSASEGHNFPGEFMSV